MDILFFKTSKNFRKWLAEHHDKQTEQWVGYYKKATKKETITWEESVKEAICFGWIDGIRKSINEESYKIRFTPRKPNSIWSLKNMKIIQELIDKGLMHQAGLDIYAKRKESKTGIYAFEQKNVALSVDYEKQLKANKKAWTYFSTKAQPSYRKTAIHWVMSAKQEKTRIKRLNQLIADSEDERKVKPFRRKGE